MTTRREFIAGGVAAGVALASARVEASEAHPLLVSVITCPRPHGASYVAGTLAAVDAGVPLSVRRLLICDGARPAVPSGWEAVDVPPRSRRNGALPDNKDVGWLAIMAAAAAGADLLFLEDDIRPLPDHRDAFARMAAHEVPSGAAFTSFFSKFNPAGCYDSGRFEMSQAVKIPARSLAWLARGPGVDPGLWLRTTGVDIAIGQLGARAGWRYEQTDNLVEHIGMWSAAHPGT